MSAVRILMLAAFFAVAACDDHGKTPQQIVAKGTDFEVTVSELDQLLKAAPAVGRDQVLPARQTILDALIGQKLLAEAAIHQKLDQNPAVMQAIEAARRSILAKAYADQIAAVNRPPSDRELQAYYENHPQLFAARRVVSVDEISLPIAVSGLDNYRAIFEKDGLNALLDQLAGEGVTVRRAARELAPEDLPAATFAQLAKLKVGDSISYIDRNSFNMGVITAVEAQPLNLQAARPMIVPQMLMQRRDEIVQTEIARLRTARQVVTFNNMLKANGETSK